ncbi:terminase TerL endonuclease subunit [Diplocloster modestus]|uniref:Terminase large subunit n=1 Tax=Diplocloster modestus TaxID=2850322 RepID=A0ABS6KCN4_9FIRM|nr:terminase TerL endonuclease subunit [Diplocloster modestus]MBU9728277.1 terminase large subunit [Diplocloster modestus]
MILYDEVPEISEYIEQVKNGEYPVCLWQKRLVFFIEKVFSNEILTIKTDVLKNYMGLQKYFPFDLLPWEKFCFTLHNCVFREDGLPRFPDLLIFVGRGAGKNGYLAFEDFCLISPYHEVREYDIDICATGEDQARMSFDDVYNVLENPKNRKKLRKHFYWNKEVIKGIKNNSKLKYRTNNAKTKDGLRSGKVDFDEVHAYETYDSIKVFTTALGKKPHPRRTYATTNGDISDGVLDDLIEKADKILPKIDNNGVPNWEDTIEDNGMLCFICMLDRKEEYADEKMWHKANPSLRYFPNLYEETKKEYIDYCDNPDANSDFMTKRMNIREGINKEIQLTDWENIKATNQPIPWEDLEGQSAIAGIDYTKINDFASCGLLFRKNGKFIWFQQTWVCKNSKDLPRIKYDMKGALRKGEIIMVDGLEIDPDLISEWIAQQMTKYNIQRVALDNYRLSLIKKSLEKVGIIYDPDKKMKDQVIQLVRPSNIELVEPIIDSAFTNHNIIWGDCQTMRWYANNTKKVQTKKNGNYQYKKIEAKSRKTDGFFAFAAAMTQWEDLPEILPPPPQLQAFVF